MTDQSFIDEVLNLQDDYDRAREEAQEARRLQAQRQRQEAAHSRGRDDAYRHMGAVVSSPIMQHMRRDALARVASQYTDEVLKAVERAAAKVEFSMHDELQSRHTVVSFTVPAQSMSFALSAVEIAYGPRGAQVPLSPQKDSPVEMMTTTLKSIRKAVDAGTYADVPFFERDMQDLLRKYGQ